MVSVSRSMCSSQRGQADCKNSPQFAPSPQEAVAQGVTEEAGGGSGDPVHRALSVLGALPARRGSTSPAQVLQGSEMSELPCPAQDAGGAPGQLPGSAPSRALLRPSSCPGCRTNRGPCQEKEDTQKSENNRIMNVCFPRVSCN
ncbi:hypothetical protein GHT09_018014 [Marmota monax]|uniref:Uncharacterized protein n=1 Tax=Marmota monax TaxID=9995 RepID=A0A834Q4Z6_MARMO|nr:hypothetical protein GHT09_018014 [Marmota monax]